MTTKTDNIDKPAASPSSFRIFTKPGKSGARVAINFVTGTVIEEDGAGKYFVFIAGINHQIATPATLEELAGLPAKEAE